MRIEILNVKTKDGIEFKVVKEIEKVEVYKAYILRDNLEWYLGTRNTIEEAMRLIGKILDESEEKKDVI